MATLKQWNYEVSIWTLQDSFITVLKPSNMENKGQLENEDFVIKNDGTLEFSFSIPTWLYLDGERMPNPIWFDSYHGDGIKAILVKNMTKLKVTFNKGRDEEKTFELLITNCEESHENDNVYYNVQSEGMAFHELGKVGYKISLTQDLYDPLYKEWFEGDQTGEAPAANLDFWLQTGMGLEMLPGVKEVDEAIKLVEQQHALYSNTKNRANEINSLYRIDQTLLAIRDAGIISRKAFPYYEVLNSYVSQYKSIINKTTEITEKLDAVIAAPKKVDRNKWYYIIDMDWSAYDSSRDRRKIYEEEYTKSWSYDSQTNKFSAGDIEKAREKWRNEQINLEESNKYNLTQNLAEIFGVFCRYEYIYDENYYIVGRKIIFYNNFAREQENGYLSLTYPYTASKISRTQETTELVTKMYVKPVDNEHSLSGLSTIVDVGANKMREDYVMNFDYLKLIGTISDEQYAEIENYEGEIRKWNDEIAKRQTLLDEKNNQMIKLKAEEQTLKDSDALCDQQIKSANDLNESLTNSDYERTKDKDGYLHITEKSPRSVVLTEVKDEPGISISSQLKDNGIEYSGLKAYTKYYYTGYTTGEGDEKETHYVKEEDLISTVPVYDDYSNLIQLKVATPENVSMIYLTYRYNPKLYVEEVKRIWGSRQNQDQARLKVLQAAAPADSAIDVEKPTESIAYCQKQIDKLTEKLNELYLEKQKVVSAFETMMGPALREGFWQPEGYTDGGDRYEETLEISSSPDTAGANQSKSGIVRFFWDDEKKFEDTDSSTSYKEGVEGIEIKLPYVLFQDKDAIEYLQDRIKEDNISFAFYDYTITPTPDVNTLRNYRNGSQAEILFGNKSGTLYPALLLTGAKGDITLKDGVASLIVNKPQLGQYTTNIENKQVKISVENRYPDGDDDLYSGANRTGYRSPRYTFNIRYPRIEINSPFLKTDKDNLIIKYNGVVLEQFKDYQVLVYDNKYYINLVPEILVKYNDKSTSVFGGKLDISFALSNADTSIYLDSLQVLKENAYPRVSYDVEPGVMDESFLYTAYDRLNQIVNINDFELMLENVQGYISELHINPDKMWETTFEVKNYRNKFEDLFSSIVAQTEEMKKSAYSIGLAANGFNTDGTISADTLSQSLSNNFNIFQAYLESGFDDSTVVRNQIQDILNEASIVINDAARTLYGAHVTTIKNAAYLATFRENITDALSPHFYSGNEYPTNFKPGDYWIDENGNASIATTFYGFTKTRDGLLSQIHGANVTYDAELGLVDIYGHDKINLRAGSGLYLAASDQINLVANNVLNLGAQEINLGTMDYWWLRYDEDGNVNYAASLTYSHTEEIEDENGEKVLLEVKRPVVGGIHLVSSRVLAGDKDGNIISYGSEYHPEDDANAKAYALKNYILKLLAMPENERTADQKKTLEDYAALSMNETTSKVDITPGGIELASAKGIVIKSGAGIDIHSSDNENVSVITLDKDSGVFIGGTKGVTLYGGYAGKVTKSASSPAEHTVGDVWIKSSDSSCYVAIKSGSARNNADWEKQVQRTGETADEFAARIERLTNSNGASVELNSKHLLLGFSNVANKASTAIELDEEKIVIAAGSVVDDIKQLQDGLSVTDTLVGAEFTKDKISFATNSTASGKTFRNLILMDNNGILIGNGRVNSSGKYVRSNGITTATKMGPPNSENDTDVAEGSYIKISPDKLALGSMADLYVNTNNVKLQTNASASDGSNTILAVGTNLQNVDINTSPATLLANNNTAVKLLVNKNGLYISGTIYAGSGKIGGWTIGNNYIGSGDTQSNSSVGLKMYTTTEGTPNLKEIAFWAGRINADGGFTKDNLPFYVTHNGELKASKATITGGITATKFILDGDEAESSFNSAIANSQTIKDIKTVSSVATTYQVSTSGTTIPTGTWSSSAPTTIAFGSYLWTRTITTYTGGNTSISYSVTKYGEKGDTGDKGDTGNYVKAIRVLYYLEYSTSNNYTPKTSLSAPTSPSVVTATDEKNKWKSIIPTYDTGDNAKYQMYWTCEEYTWNENIDTDKYSYSTPYMSYGITAANKTATSASIRAANIAKQFNLTFDETGLVSNYTISYGGSNHTYAAALLSQYGLLIGAGSGIDIVSSGSNLNSVVTLNKNGIALHGAAINLTTTSDRDTNSISLNENGITIGTDKTLDVSAGIFIAQADNMKFRIQSSATGATPKVYMADTAAWNDATSGMQYSEDNGLQVKGAITATSLYIGNTNYITKIQNIDNIASNASNAEQIANSKAQVFRKNAAPSDSNTNFTFAVGDIWQDTSTGIEYIANSTTKNSSASWTRVNAGKIQGAKLIVDAAAGTVSMTANNTVTIAAGKTLTMTTNGKLIISGGSGVEIGSGSKFNIASGSTFTVMSTNFKIYANGNVELTGKVTANDGAIGGWTIASNLNQLSSGSGSTYVALNSDTNTDYAIWAGSETASVAPFRVKRDGSVYLTKLYSLDANNNATQYNTYNLPFWKLNYASIKNVTITNGYCTQIILTNAIDGQTTLNFNRATGGSWNSQGQYVINSTAVTAISGVTLESTTWVSNKLIAAIGIQTTEQDEEDSPLFSRTLDLTSVYTDGYNTANSEYTSVGYLPTSVAKTQEPLYSYDAESGTYEPAGSNWYLAYSWKNLYSKS